MELIHLDLIPSEGVLLNHNLNIVQANQNFYDLVDYKSNEKLNPKLIFDRDFLNKLSQLFSEKNPPNNIKLDSKIFTKDKEVLDVSIKLNIINNKEDSYALLLIDKGIDTNELSERGLKKAFEAFTKVTSNAVSTLELDQLLERLLNRLVQVLEADTGVILLKENDYLVANKTVGFQNPSFNNYKIRIGEGFAGKIASSMKPLFVKNAQKDKRVKNPYIKEQGIKSMFGVPLKRDRQLIGVLHLDWLKVHKLSDYETHLLEITAERCAMAILNSRLYGETKQLKDSLVLRFKRMPIACIVWDIDFRVLSWNPAAEKLFGYKEDEAKGKHAYELIVPQETQQQVDEIWSNILSGDMQAYSENKNKTKDGKSILCKWTNTPFLDDHGNVIGAISMAEDITELKETQTVLNEKISELKKKNRYEQAVRAIIEQLHKNTNPEDVMKTAVQVMKNSIEIVDNVSIYLIEGSVAVMQAYQGYPEWFIEKVRRIPHPKGFTWKTILEGNPLYVNDIKNDTSIGPAGRKVGTKSYASMPIFYEGKVIGVININSYTEDAFGDDEIVFLESVTHHVETAINNARKTEKIRRSEERFSAFMENLPGAAFIKDKDGKYLFSNKAYEDIFNIKSEDVIGKTDKQIFPADLANRFAKIDKKVINEEKSSETIEELKIDEKKCYYFINKFPIFNGGETCEYLGGFAIDITERQQAKERMEEQAALLNIANDAIIVRDLEGNKVFWNKGAEKLYGWTEEEVMGQKVTRESFNIDKKVFDTVMEEGQWSGELKQLNKFNKDIFVMSSRTVVKDENGNPKSRLIVNKDITENKRMQRELLQAQRLESIGTLAGGIAHDLNNALMPIMMCVQLLRDHLSADDDKYHSWLDIIEESTQRGSELVSQVVSFARGADGERAILQPKSLIKELVKILEQTFPKSIDINYDLPDDLWSISGDITQIHQVLMNLCVNARDAMSEGGTLNVSANNLNIDENYSKMIPDAKIGDYVLISVSDTGEGISQENIDKIFDPFFTTKEHGKGTGLGLSTTFRIVKDHGGFINVYSDLGEGAAFKIYLPAAKDTNGEKVRQKQTQEIKKGEGELILVVDDDTSVRDITKITLENNGYKAMTASDGVEAIAIYSEHKDEIVIVIMDAMMPNMDGPSSISVLRKITPELKVIVTSGLRDSQKPLDKMNIRVNAVLTKPYTSELLLKTINEILSMT